MATITLIPGAADATVLFNQINAGAQERFLQLMLDGQQSMARLLGQAGQLKPSESHVKAIEDVVAQANDLFGEGFPIPTDAVHVELIPASVKSHETSLSAISQGPSAQLNAARKELARIILCVNTRGETIQTLEVDRLGNYIPKITIQVCATNNTSPAEVRQVFAHELGHQFQYTYGAIFGPETPYARYNKNQAEINAAWSAINRILNLRALPMQTKLAPLNREAWLLEKMSLPTLPIFSPEKNKEYWALRDSMDALIAERERLDPKFRGFMSGNKMLREGFACWFAGMLGYETNTGTALLDAQQAIIAPYERGHALFNVMPLKEALTVGLTATSDSELEKAAGPYLPKRTLADRLLSVFER